MVILSVLIVCLSCCLSLVDSHRDQFLGLFLFSLYVNDLLGVTVQIKMFANDTKIYYSHSHLDGSAFAKC